MSKAKKMCKAVSKVIHHLETAQDKIDKCIKLSEKLERFTEKKEDLIAAKHDADKAIVKLNNMIIAIEEADAEDN